jgi:hypothetical protein
MNPIIPVTFGSIIIIIALYWVFTTEKEWSQRCEIINQAFREVVKDADPNSPSEMND